MIVYVRYRGEQVPVQIDPEDFALWATTPGKWYVYKKAKHDTRYIVNVRKENGRTRTRWLHRMILGIGDVSEPLVDHINGDGLDCRRANLRIADPMRNCHNRRPQRHKISSPLKGVTRDGGRWRAVITVKGKHVHLGMFDDEVEAARAYDAAAREHFGAFARPNFPEGVQST